MLILCSEHKPIAFKPSGAWDYLPDVAYDANGAKLSLNTQQLRHFDETMRTWPKNNLTAHQQMLVKSPN